MSISPISAPPLPRSPEIVCVDQNIFLGTTRLIPDYNSVILEKKISRILTLTLERNDKKFDKIPQIYYKHISMQEHNCFPLIYFFYECLTNISEAQTYEENILILGEGIQSISVTIVIAFLMGAKEDKKTASQVFNQLSQIWNIRPKDYFNEQLYLWQNMKCRIDANNRSLRRIVIKWFRYNFESLIFGKVMDFNELRENYLKICFDYVFLIGNLEQSDTNLKLGPQHFCSKCKTRLYYDCNLIKNDIEFDCKLIYTDPINWCLAQIYRNAKIKENLIYTLIKCKNCFQLIGFFDFNLKTGCRCRLHEGLELYLISNIFADRVVVEDIKKNLNFSNLHLIKKS